MIGILHLIAVLDWVLITQSYTVIRRTRSHSHGAQWLNECWDQALAHSNPLCQLFKARLTCVSCKGAVYPHSCNKVENCGPNSVCSVERYVSGSSVLYDLGCRDSMFCQSNGRRSNVVNTTDYRPRSGHIALCRECCTSSMCNSAGCGNQGYVGPRGPICFSCDQRLTVDDCDTIQICSRDEQCIIQGHTFGTVHYYTTRCASGMVCDAITSASKPQPVGRSVINFLGDDEFIVDRNITRQRNMNAEKAIKQALDESVLFDRNNRPADQPFYGNKMRQENFSKEPTVDNARNTDADDRALRQTGNGCSRCCNVDLCNRDVC